MNGNMFCARCLNLGNNVAARLLIITGFTIRDTDQNDPNKLAALFVDEQKALPCRTFETRQLCGRVHDIAIFQRKFEVGEGSFCYDEREDVSILGACIGKIDLHGNGMPFCG